MKNIASKHIVVAVIVFIFVVIMQLFLVSKNDVSQIFWRILPFDQFASILNFFGIVGAFLYSTRSKERLKLPTYKKDSNAIEPGMLADVLAGIAGAYLSHTFLNESKLESSENMKTILIGCQGVIGGYIFNALLYKINQGKDRIKKQSLKLPRNILFISRAMLPFYILGLIGVVFVTIYSILILAKSLSLICIFFFVVGSACLIGFVIGFLFGVPYEIDFLFFKSSKKADLPGGRRNLTNLERISGLLIIALIGLSITQSNNIYHIINLISIDLGIEKNIFIYAVVIYFSITGFFLGYLWTRIYYENGDLDEEKLDISDLVDHVDERVTNVIENLLGEPALDNFRGRVFVEVLDEKGNNLPYINSETNNDINFEESKLNWNDKIPKILVDQKFEICIYFCPESRLSKINNYGSINFSEYILIAEGKDVDKVQFDIAVNSEKLNIKNEKYKSSIVQINDISSPEVFKFQSNILGEHEIWIEIFQKNRLIQSFHIPISVENML